MRVEFREADHSYRDRDSGRQVPGVSAVIRAAGYGRDMSGIDPAVLENARRRGTEVHDLCRTWESSNESLNPNKWQLDAWVYLDGFKKFCKDFDPRPCDWEALVWDQELWVAGRYDLLCEIGGEKWLIDLKATAELHEENQIQVAAYAHLAESRWMSHYRKAILHLTPKTVTKPYRLLEVVDPRATELFIAACKQFHERGNHEQLT